MPEYGGDLHFVCLEARALAKKQFSFKILFITQLSQTLHFSNNSIYSRYLVVTT